MEPRSNIEWRQWAKYDPLFGVSTRKGRAKGQSNPWTLEEFYDYGVTNWEEYYPRWQQYGVVTESCLEIGCGAGRITRQLIRYFGSVRGIDIAPEMLEIAHRNVPEAAFFLSDGGTLPVPDESVTAVFSSEVFQHLDSRDFALEYFREIHRVLRPSASCMIQIPICVLPLRRVLPLANTAHRLLWGAADYWVRIKSNGKRYLIVHRHRRPFYRMMQYEPDWLSHHLSRIGFTDIEIRMFGVTGDPGRRYLDSFMLARKGSDSIKHFPDLVYGAGRKGTI